MPFQEIANRLDLRSSEAARNRYRYWTKKVEGDEGDSESDKQDTGCIIIGATPDDYDISPTEVWERVFKAQDAVLEFLAKRQTEQRIILKPPCLWAFLSDLHFGDPMTDYRAAKRDAEIIRDTEDAWAGFHGDGVNNWIIGKLASLQRHEVIDLDAEWLLFFDWLNILGSSLVYVCTGNHDNWVIKVAGFDRVREALRGTRVLYHTDQIVFVLQVGDKEYRVKVRHKWRGSSVFNVTHGIEVGWERGGDDFDIGIGGHTHQGTYCRPFTRHGQKRYAVLTGTYKVGDSYGEELGFAPPASLGCGALVFDENGEIDSFYEDVEKAARNLEFLKGKV